MTNTAKDLSTKTANTSFFSLRNPSDRTAASYTFDSLEEARAFKQQHCLDAYRVAYVEFFDGTPDEGSA